MRANTNFSLRLQFDKDAELYDKARPHYPKELFNAIVDTTGIKPPAEILEVGCGSGQATFDLGSMGYNVTAIEPGENLADIARTNCAALMNVQIVTDFFEDWKGPESKFDAIVSANAWHWVRPDVAYLKAASLLNENGHLAVFWNFPEIEDEAVSRDIQRITDEMALAADGLSCYYGVSNQVDSLIDKGIEESKKDGVFAHVDTHVITQKFNMSAEHFVDWIGTYSNIQNLEKQDRENLNTALKKYINGLDESSVALTNKHVLRVSKKISQPKSAQP